MFLKSVRTLTVGISRWGVLLFNPRFLFDLSARVCTSTDSIARYCQRIRIPVMSLYTSAELIGSMPVIKEELSVK